MSIILRGYSDDVISLGGDVAEEFSAIGTETGEDGHLIAFSDGTLLRIQHTSAGVWRIVKHAETGTATVEIHVAADGDDIDEDDYSDIATVTSAEDAPIVWVGVIAPLVPVTRRS